MKIAIGLPTTGITKTDTTVCLMKLAARLAVNYGGVDIIPAYGTVEQARNLVVDEFLKTDCTHLLFWDWDATGPENSAEVLYNADKDVIGVNAAKKRTGNPVIENNTDGEPLNYIKHEMEQTGLIGMHVTMIKREVFEAMPWPWFIPEVVEGQRKMAGEDFVFCKKATQLHDFEVWVHNQLSIEVGHIAEHTLYLLPHIQKQIDAHKKEQYTKELQKLKDDLCLSDTDSTE